MDLINTGVGQGQNQLRFVAALITKEFTLQGAEDRLVLFVVTPSEEKRLRLALAERAPDIEILVSGLLFDGNTQTLNRTFVKSLEEAESLAVTSEEIQSDVAAKLMCRAHVSGKRIIDIEAALLEVDPTVSTVGSDLIRNLAHASLHQSTAVRFYRAAKDFFEPAIAGIFLVLLSPLFLLVAAAIKWTSPGPIFYAQSRRGLNGKPFDLLKFRSMRTDAEAGGAVWASAQTNDPRLTPIGGLLRATHIDELPQLINVLMGEISIVGPRPERPVFCEKLAPEVPLFELRTLVKPGITGWAQIRQGYANSIDDSRRKLEFDLYYILKHSPIMDLKIVLGTVLIVLTGGTEGRKRKRLAAAERYAHLLEAGAAVTGLRRERLTRVGRRRKKVAEKLGS